MGTYETKLKKREESRSVAHPRDKTREAAPSDVQADRRYVCIGNSVSRTAQSRSALMSAVSFSRSVATSSLSSDGQSRTTPSSSDSRPSDE